MKKILAFTVGIVAVFTFAISSSVISAGSFKLADATFAKKVCSAWNNSSLPYRLGSEKDRKYRGRTIEGSDWIHSMGKKNGKQKIVAGRYDCKGWKAIEFVIEEDAEGLAKCVSAGNYSGSGLTWKFVPSSANWYEFAGGFGMMAFKDLWSNGMVGKYGTAWSNRGNFAIFFRLAGRIALNADWRSGCSGLKVNDVKEEIKDLKDDWNIK